MWRVRIERLGLKVIEFCTGIFELFSLLIETVKSLKSIWFYRRQVIEQFYVILVRTLPIAAVISVFLGMGMMIQGIYQGSSLLPRMLTINVIFKTTVYEICPILLSLVLAGKLGGSLAAEIGSMKISEQLDALETLSLDPVGFIVMPRVLAALIMVPVIMIFANFVALFTVFFVSTVATDWISPGEFLSGLRINVRIFELYFGNFIKPSIYGFLIALVGSYFGLKTRGGALGVGRSSTNAVVACAILIVIFDYYLDRVLL
jgi:phospholipid/cholesterol/gamma-HCH transport system permease protein